ncbi:MAG TPA: hypothetical protein VL202_15055 [Pararhizobium sp.]|uniref:hypothetical protein n=1 Tax=Pararhizobium sp. TaxID=1977563 RepID=UPI002BF5C79B|nr:hypothetical protein [Pararhizobium sp.]HTO32474.1 hypothetical protein [Pararhizobium sp.]
MAETEFAVAEQRLMDILIAVFSIASIAIHDKSSLVEDVSELHDRLMRARRNFL